MTGVNRRDFVGGLASLVGLSVSGSASGQAAPCPPPNLAAEGGSEAVTLCPTERGELPGWISTAIDRGWRAGEWLAISGNNPTSGYGLTSTNRLRDVKTTPVRGTTLQDIMSAWCGGAFASRHGTFGTYIIGLGGGHGSYNGNDIFGFDMETRRWSELKADYTGGSGGNAYGEYPDGSPLPHHTYNYPAYLPNQNAFFVPRGVSSTAGQTPQVATPYPQMLPLHQSNFFRGAPITDAVGAKNGWKQGGSGVWVPSIERYVLQGSNSSSSANLCWCSYDPAADRWTQHANGWFTTIETAIAHEATNDRLLIAEFRSSKQIRYKPAQDLNATPVQVTQTGSAPPLERGQGWIWSPNLRATLYYRRGTGVYALRHRSGSTYEWSHLTTGGNSVSPQGDPRADNGLFNRVQVASYGATDILFYCADVAGAVYAFRVT